jgi:hypothetical protein
MLKLNIELPETYVVSMRNGASVEVDIAKLFAQVGAEVALYGVGQVLRDSASGASKAAEAEGSKGVQAEAQAMMDAKLANLLEGNWTMRGEGGGVDPRTSIARSIVRKAIKEKFGSKSPEWAKFTGLSDADQLAKLDETYAANAEMFDPAIDAEIKRRADANKSKAKLASGLSISI